MTPHLSLTFCEDIGMHVSILSAWAGHKAAFPAQMSASCPCKPWEPAGGDSGTWVQGTCVGKQPGPSLSCCEHMGNELLEWRNLSICHWNINISNSNIKGTSMSCKGTFFFPHNSTRNESCLSKTILENWTRIWSLTQV